MHKLKVSVIQVIQSFLEKTNNTNRLCLSKDTSTDKSRGQINDQESLLSPHMMTDGRAEPQIKDI